jgi:hypothetical protein
VELLEKFLVLSRLHHILNLTVSILGIKAFALPLDDLGTFGRAIRFFPSISVDGFDPELGLLRRQRFE